MVKKHSSAGWTWLRPLTMFTLLMFVASFDTSSYSLKWSNFLAVWVWNLLFFFTYLHPKPEALEVVDEVTAVVAALPLSQAWCMAWVLIP